ncbi:MAG TPA: D-isomer specific 2-hydroxyacid dehydrogenase family protein [Ilumatobacteraceae bacterium]|nr:D-isomer specific 2-hydroxyacid dehydrogenase family protein [Ilumatobacteraceae bacterium]
MSSPDAPRIALAPDTAPDWLAEAIAEGGGHLVPLAEADGIIWADPRDPAALEAALPVASNASWVQLPFAGIENFVHLIDDEHVWTCGKGVYAEPVAELALGLGVGGLRGIGQYARCSEWSRPIGRNLLGGRVSILGGGGIAESLVRLLQPFDCHITVVRQNVSDMDGVDDVLEADRYPDALAGADLVVLALPLTSETDGIIGRGEFKLMEEHAWLINVARGRHIVTDELVDALRDGVIGGAGLDVTDPEPLPADHPLWSLPNCIITPHVGNTPEMARPLLAERVTANVRRFAQGAALIGLVDTELGY